MIDSFMGKYRYLSNFHLSPVLFEDVWYPSTENAYQAAKTLDPNLRFIFADPAFTPKEAKKKGRTLHLRPDWEFVKYDIMYRLVKFKFKNNKDLARKLIGTGNEILKEGNWWHDNVWGSCTCIKCQDCGLNHLGNILMKVREEIATGINNE